MEPATEEQVSTKRRKTETNEPEDQNETELLEDTSGEEDYESFLKEFLDKKPANNLTIFQRVVKQEEDDARDRNSSLDLKLYHDACADFAECVADIAEVKATKADGWKDRVNELRKEAAFITLIMKKLNRVEKTRTKISREKINKERHLVDLSQLKLDNLTCETIHLRKEIEKCLKFKSRPLGIDLVSVEEFYKKAPPSISQPEVTKSDEHQLQLARLEWELKQRKELASLLSELESKKASITDQIDKRESDLNSLAPLIKDVLVVTQPLQEKLGSPQLTKNLAISESAPFLPDPLYFLYIQAKAYSEACDKNLNLLIKGDLIEARRIKDFSVQDKSITDKNSLEDNENLKKDVSLEQKNLLLPHPLSVQIKTCLTYGCSLELIFYYLKNLNIITVVPSLNIPSMLKTPTTEVLLESKNLLSNLFSGDTGLESPNLANYYQLKKVGLESIDIEKHGAPYVWTQKIGGLNFCSLNLKVEPNQDVSRTNMPVILKELRRRSQYRISLIKQIISYGKGNVLPPTTMRTLKVNCILKSWKSICWSEFNDHPSSQHFKDSCYISPNDFCFNGVLSRGEATLDFLVAIKPDFPMSPSLFTLQLEWNSNIWTSKNTSYLMDVEREVNVYWKELLTSRIDVSSLLSYQIFKTMICFDIILEVLDPANFPSNKVFSIKHRGRNRVLPLKFRPEASEFVQRNLF